MITQRLKIDGSNIVKQDGSLFTAWGHNYGGGRSTTDQAGIEGAWENNLYAPYSNNGIPAFTITKVTWVFNGIAGVAYGSVKYAQYDVTVSVGEQIPSGIFEVGSQIIASNIGSTVMNGDKFLWDAPANKDVTATVKSKTNNTFTFVKNFALTSATTIANPSSVNSTTTAGLQNTELTPAAAVVHPPSVESDLYVLKKNGSKIIRVCIQLNKFMNNVNSPNEYQLNKLYDFLNLAAKYDIYVIINGANTWTGADQPDWLIWATEENRWLAQANFWRAVANKIGGHPVLAWYSLINEPVDNILGEGSVNNYLESPPFGNNMSVSSGGSTIKFNTNGDEGYGIFSQLADYTTGVEYVTKLYNWAGEWSAGNYETLSLVTYNNNYYVTNASTTSSPENNPWFKVKWKTEFFKYASATDLGGGDYTVYSITRNYGNYGELLNNPTNAYVAPIDGNLNWNENITGGFYGIGVYYNPYIVLSNRNRTNKDIARLWINKMKSAIKEVDKNTPITFGAMVQFGNPNVSGAGTGNKAGFSYQNTVDLLDIISPHQYPSGTAVASTTIVSNLEATLEVWNGAITTVTGSTSATFTTNSGTFTTGMTVTSANIPAGTTVIVSGSNITLSNAATATGTGTASSVPVVKLTKGNTQGLVIGQTVSKISGTGVFGGFFGTPSISSINSNTEFTVNSNHATSGPVVFSILDNQLTIDQNVNAIRSMYDPANLKPIILEEGAIPFGGSLRGTVNYLLKIKRYLAGALNNYAGHGWNDSDNFGKAFDVTEPFMSDSLIDDNNRVVVTGPNDPNFDSTKLSNFVALATNIPQVTGRRYLSTIIDRTPTVKRVTATPGSGISASSALPYTFSVTAIVGYKINSVSGSGTTKTFTTSSNHNLYTGQSVEISGFTPTAYNTSSANHGTVTVPSGSTNTFQLIYTANPGTATVAGSVIVEETRVNSSETSVPSSASVTTTFTSNKITVFWSAYLNPETKSDNAVAYKLPTLQGYKIYMYDWLNSQYKKTTQQPTGTSTSIDFTNVGYASPIISPPLAGFKFELFDSFDSSNKMGVAIDGSYINQTQLVKTGSFLPEYSDMVLIPNTTSARIKFDLNGIYIGSNQAVVSAKNVAYLSTNGYSRSSSITNSGAGLTTSLTNAGTSGGWRIYGGGTTDPGTALNASPTIYYPNLPNTAQMLRSPNSDDGTPTLNIATNNIKSKFTATATPPVTSLNVYAYIKVPYAQSATVRVLANDTLGDLKYNSNTTPDLINYRGAYRQGTIAIPTAYQTGDIVYYKTLTNTNEGIYKAKNSGNSNIYAPTNTDNWELLYETKGTFASYSTNNQNSETINQNFAWIKIGTLTSENSNIENFDLSDIEVYITATKNSANSVYVAKIYADALISDAPGTEAAQVQLIPNSLEYSYPPNASIPYSAATISFKNNSAAGWYGSPTVSGVDGQFLYGLTSQATMDNMHLRFVPSNVNYPNDLGKSLVMGTSYVEVKMQETLSRKGTPIVSG
jgi:hypothetical protein